MTRYVWFFIDTGKFSCSWTQREHDLYSSFMEDVLNAGKERNAKLIKYECLTDEKFEFYDMMKIVTNVDKK